MISSVIDDAGGTFGVSFSFRRRRGRSWNVEQVRLLQVGERLTAIFADGTSIVPIVLSAHGLDPARNGVSKTNFHVIFDLCGAGDFRDQHEKRRLLLD